MKNFVIFLSVLLATVFVKCTTEVNSPVKEKDYFLIAISHSTKQEELHSAIGVTIEGAPKRDKYLPKITNNYGPNGEITSTTVLLTKEDGQEVNKRQSPPFLDYEYHPGFGYYKFFSPATWREAFFICKSQGAQLAIVNSKEEINLLRRIADKHPKAAGITFPNYTLLGFHDLYKEGNFVTVKGELLVEAGFSQFGPHINYKPNGGAGENCGCMYNGNESLDDISCDVPTHFICEKEIH